MTRITTSQRVLIALMSAALTAGATAESVTITVENNSPANGFGLTPVWLGIHDGSFDVFETGLSSEVPARDGITQIAELGATGPISARFASEQPSGVDTTLAQPATGAFLGGSSATTTLNVGDSSVNRFFNYASMVVPTNDLFIGNDNALELFDASGNFLGNRTILVFGSDVYDNGSEVNDFSNGPAFVPGVDATGGIRENGVVTLFFDDPNASSYLDSIIGTNTAAGFEVGAAFDSNSLLATITITPEPTSAILLLGAAALLVRRR